MRKLLIGVVSLGAVLGAYLLYRRVSDTPVFQTRPGVEVVGSAADGNAAALDGETGRIGQVGLGPVRKAEYVTLNQKTKRVERKFGFERLLHETGDVWEIEKPYMNIYRPNLTCFVTADKGQVQVETAVGKTTPRDATFSSNVVIHIVPEGPGSVKESFVYLDDVVFLSKKSLLSTAGPVKFVSEDAQMQGTGLELIYNDQAERLEYFKIADLESLRIKSTQAAALSAGPTPAEAPAATGAQTEAPEPNETPVARNPQEGHASPPDTQPQAAQKQGVFYKCVLSRNVLLDAPDQLIFADEKLIISDVFWSKDSMASSGEANAGGAEKTETAAPAAGPDRPLAAAADEPNVSVPERAEPNEPNVPAEQPAFIVVTCDGGLVIVPKDSARPLDDSAQADPNAAASNGERPELFATDTERTKFSAAAIDYNAISGDVVAEGLSQLAYYAGNAAPAEANEPRVPVKVTARRGTRYSRASNRAVFQDCWCRMPQTGLSERRDVTFSSPQITVDIPPDGTRQPDLFAVGPTELVFYTEDANGPAAGQGPVPVRVTAHKQARYSGTSNQMAFEGDCRCTMVREDPNVVVQYVLLAEQIGVELTGDVNEGPSGPAGGVKHLTAVGEVVNLATTRTARAGGSFAKALQDAGGTKLLGGIELKCRQFDYDAIGQFFLATGPGLIKLINSAPADPNDQGARLSLARPCVAVIDRFETLTYLIRENRVTADAGSQRMLIDYFSTVGGRPEYARAEASHVDALLNRTLLGQTELSTLAARGGIYYEDSDNRFLGSEMFYDHNAAIVKVGGDEAQPCYYNGALVDGIELNLNTGKVKANVVGPGALQLPVP